MHRTFAYIYSLALALTFILPPAAALDLDGLELRCCTIIEAPFVRRDDATEQVFDGLAIDVLQHLQSALGFRCSSLREFVDGAGAPLTFNAAVAHMEACANGTDAACACDLGVGSWVLTEQRLGRADFVAPFALDRYRFITHENNTKSPVDRVSILTPFGPSVWTAVVVLAVVLWLLKGLDALVLAQGDGPEFPTREVSNGSETSRPEVDTATEGADYRRKMTESLRFTGKYIVGLAKRENAPTKRSWRENVLNILIFSVGFFLSITYMAVMTNALTVEGEYSKVRSVRYFQECLIPANEVCVTEGSGAQEYWEHAIASRNCHFRRDAPRVNTAQTFNDTFRAFRNYECNYLLGLGSDLQNVRRGMHCRGLRLSGAPFRDAGVSFILPPGSNLTDTLSAATLGLRLRGALRTTQETLELAGSCVVDAGVSIPAHKIQVFVLFLLSVSGVVLALILCARWRALPQEPDAMP